MSRLQIQWLLWKNGKMKRRAIRATLFEILLPIASLLLFSFLKTSTPPETIPAIPEGPVTPLGDLAQLAGYKGLGGWITAPQRKIGVVGDITNISTKRVIGGLLRVMHEAEEAASGNNESNERVIVFSSISELEAEEQANPNTFLLSVICHEPPLNSLNQPTFAYSIRVNSTNIPEISSPTAVSVAMDARLAALAGLIQTYITSGFMAAQTTVETSLWQPTPSVAIPPIMTITTKTFPISSMRLDLFAESFRHLCSFYLMVGFFPLFSSLLIAMVSEKETGLSDVLAIVGIKKRVVWLSWWITYSLQSSITVLLMTVLAWYLSLFPPESCVLFYLMLYLYALTLISFAVLVSTLFSRVRVAGTVGGIAIMALYSGRFLVSSTSSASLCIILSFFSPVALSLGTDIALTATASDNGTTLELSSSSNSHTLPFIWILVMLAVDSVLYLLIAIGVNWWKKQSETCWCPCIPKLFRPSSYSRLTGDDREDVSGVALRTNGNSSDANTPEDGVEMIDLVRQRMSGNALNGTATSLIEDTHANDDGATIAVKCENLTKTFPKSERCSWLRSTLNHWGWLVDDRVPAVSSLSLSLRMGEVVSLLGHNGAGKSTLISMLIGSLAPDSGDVFIMNKTVVSDVEAARSHIGVCPQVDILFPFLTLEEHLIFFDGIKSSQISEGEYIARGPGMKALFLVGGSVLLSPSSASLIDQLDLQSMKQTLGSALSGGTKRKLSLAISVLGKPRVLFLDEPTAGVDPVSRRLVWDLIRKFKTDGSLVVLTTHMMDEADILGDRIAVLSAGRLQCLGSSLFLKRRLGMSYDLSVSLEHDNGNRNLNEIGSTPTNVNHYGTSSPMAQRLTTLVTSIVPSATVRHSAAADLSYSLPLLHADKFPALFTEMDSLLDNNDKNNENNSNHIKIVSYGVSFPSLEQAMLKLADWQGDTTPTSATVSSSHFGTSSTTTSTPDDTITLSTIVSESFSIAATLASSGSQSAAEVVCCGSRWWQQLRAMLTKRRLVASRTIFSLAFELVSPPMVAIIAIVALRLLSPALPSSQGYGVTDVPLSIKSLSGSAIPIMTDDVTLTTQFIAAMTNNNTDSNWQDINLWLAPSSLAFRKSFTTDPLTKACVDGRPCYGAFVFNHKGQTVTVMINSTHQETLPILVNAIHSGNFRVAAWSDKEQEVVSAPSLSVQRVTYPTSSLITTVISAYFAFLIGNSFGNLPFGFISQLVKEKESRGKTILLLLGLRYEVYVIGNVIADGLLYCCSLGLVAVLVCIAPINADMESGATLLPAFVLLLLHGPASLLFIYFLSLPFPTAASFQSIIPLVYQALTSLGLLTCLFLDLFPFIIPVSTWGGGAVIAATLRSVFSVLPSFSLTFGLIKLSLSNTTVEELTGKAMTSGSQGSSNKGVFAWTNAGASVVSLLLVIVCIPVAMLLLDPSGPAYGVRILRWIKRRCCRFMKRDSLANVEFREMMNEDAGGEGAEDSEVVAERQRVLTHGSNDDILRVLNLCKTYDPPCSACLNTNGGGSGSGGGSSSNCCQSSRAPIRAVCDVTFGVSKGASFTILGPNGAGKTSLIGMIAREVIPSAGSATVVGHVLCESDPPLPRLPISLGYCPQSCALFDWLTVREHLQLIKRMRGVRGDDESDFALAKNLGLDEHFDKTVKTCSVGTRRKVSLAMAVMGAPALIILDEPSSGMDTSSRRTLWNFIASLRQAQRCGDGDVEQDAVEGRCVVLTTHMMEEAEAIGSAIAIMINGRLCCLGSPQHLKHKYGKQSYTVELRTSGSPLEAISFLQSEVDRRAVVTENVCHRARVQLSDGCAPPDSLANDGLATQSPVAFSLGRLFSLMETNRHRLGILDYSISQPTLDHIFLEFAKRQKGDTDVTS